MRVVAGALGGRSLAAPVGAATRPSSDLVRGALFAALEARRSAWGHRALVEVRVLDLFAGSGALGIEALSRGATHAVFVESDRRALAVLWANLDDLGLRERATVVAGDARAYLAGPVPGAFGLILADPPYAQGVASLLPLLARGDRLAPDGLCALQHGAREELPERSGTLQRLLHRVHGGTALSIYAARADRG